MANEQLYTKASVYINGRLLTESSNVTIKRESGSNPVETIHKGYAGESPGAKKANITVRNAVPSADFELDPGPFMNNDEAVELSIFAAGRTATATGFIYEDNFQMGVGNAAELEFSFRTGQLDWQ